MGKKRNVVKAYDTTAENVHDSMDALFNEHEEKSSSAHSAQLKRLKELLNHKAKLEAQMEAKLTVLRADYDAHSRDVENVLSHKIRELK
ncbi:hypothetical protein CC86DRAFT_365862 [Ophiobolus disseminans]|uniref:Uncharacterized protein n=1 Tax=Ophiobolus disseminans TaxID=1469910 RepID=A0A6A7AGB4_9PLEO|nr:hypothetical protein CC86DRAFT_365862 [Ophiobolus disseminans]